MKRTMSGAMKAAVSLAAASGVIIMAALPAAAASPNRSYAFSAGGLLVVSPQYEATFPGTSPVTAAGLTTSQTDGLATSGVITDTATGTTASSTINDLNAGPVVGGTVTATTVTSSCTFDTGTGTVTGTTTIEDGLVTGAGRSIPLASNPSPNDTVAGVGRIASIILNKQTTAADGTLTVTAIAISLLSGQTINIGVSVCNAANLAPVPVLPGQALPVAGGLAALALIAAAYQVARRCRTAAAR